MDELRFDRFVKKIFIRSAPKKIYDCWTTESGLTSWFLENAEFFSDGEKIPADQNAVAGNTYTWKWYNYDPLEHGKVTEANGKDHFQFSFAGDCLVTVDLETFEDGTIVTLVQSNIPTDDKTKLTTHVGCSNGWTFWMTNLKAYLEHGILLHEKTIDLTKNPLAPWEFINI